MPRAMSEALAQTKPFRSPLSGWIWLAAMVGSWVVFFYLALFRESTLAEIWQAIRDLPLLVEGIVWLLFFPLVLGTAVWESSWETWLRALLVICFAAGWSFAFVPRAKKGTRDAR